MQSQLRPLQRLSLGLGFTIMLAAGTLVGCGDDDSYSNREACENWLSTYNALSCVEGVATVDVETACGGYSNSDEVDCSELFDCWAANMECETIAGTDVETINNYTADCPTSCE